METTSLAQSRTMPAITEGRAWRWLGWWPSCLLIIGTLVLFAPVWREGQLLAFRDTYHFYYPLWAFIDRQPFIDRLIPIWNPLDGFGCSMIGESTTMAFYPGRWILHLPVGKLEQRIGWFLIIHIWLAYFGWIYASWRLGFPLWISQLAAAGYALSGPLFFQIYNPPFLVGGAWLPLTLYAWLNLLGVRAWTNLVLIESCIDRRTCRSTWWAASLFAGSTAMIVLGGDAQTAYHVALIGMLGVLVLIGQQVITRLMSFRDGFRNVLHGLTRLALGLGLAFGIASIQIFPTYHWLKLSERNRSEGTVSNSELVRSYLGIQFDYAIDPWDYVTTFVPNVLGDELPTITRWPMMFRLTPSCWTPSLHVGSLIVLAAIAGWLAGPRKPLAVLSLAVTVIAFGSSLGRYNLYEVWNACLPGYHQFRYPAKWTTFFAWGIGIGSMLGLAQLELDGFRHTLRRGFFLLIGLGGISLALNLAIYLYPPFREAVFDFVAEAARSRGLTHSFDFAAASQQLGTSGLLILVTAGCSLFLLQRWAIRPQPGVLSLILIGEMLVAASPMTMFVEAVVANSFPPDLPLHPGRLPPIFAEQAEQHPNAEECARRGLTQVWRFGDLALPVFRTSDEATPRPVSQGWPLSHWAPAYQCDAIMGKLHLMHQVRSFRTYFTMSPKTMRLAVPDHRDQHEVEHPLYDASIAYYWQHRVTSLENPPDTLPLGPGDAALRADVSFSKVTIEGHRLKFSYASPVGFYLQLPVLDDGGWHIEGEAAPSPITKNITGLLTLRLPKGDHTVSLINRPPGLIVGRWISFATCGLVLGLCLVCLARGKPKEKAGG